MSKTKRQDLQGIRGFAILAVLLFHFFPKQFPNGYIGVDQFFVLSGYLIALVLSREDSIGLDSIRSFYYRRIKRIVPLYILCILSILLALLFIFPDLIFEKNSESAWSALFFITNLRGDDPKKQYLLLLTVAEDAFAHTWSLAVEMQFYLLVPIFFYILTHIPTQFRNFFIAAVVSLSGIYHVTTDDYSSFNSVFARLWQFFSGIYAFLCTQHSDRGVLERSLVDQERKSFTGSGQRSSPEKMTSPNVLSSIVGFCCMITLLMSLYPTKIPDLLLRIAVTLQTVAMMIAGSSAQNILVSNKPICYLGDISYAVYLVHWPIYSYCKQTSEDYNLNVFYVGFVFSIVVGIVLTETYEKFYLSLTQRNIFLLIIGLYVCCICLLIPSKLDTSNEFVLEKPKKENWTKEQVIEINNRIQLNDALTLRLTNQCRSESNKTVLLDEWCEFEGLGHGSKKMMIIGNSWAANNAPTIYNKCGNKASRMTMFSPINCEALVHTKYCCQNHKCPEQHEKLLKFVQKDKPDVLFMMFRHLELFVVLKNGTKDYLVEYATQRMKEFEKVVKERIFVLDAVPRNTDQILKKLNKAIKEGKTITQAEVDTGDDWRLARSRLKKIVETCKKCELIDYMPAFSENGEFRFFDNFTGLSYFSHAKHLTPYGKKFTESVIEHACRRL